MVEIRPLNPEDPAAVGGHRILGRLGEGGQGIVFLGEGPGGQRVAVKILQGYLTANAEARERFVREVRIATSVARFCTAQILATGVVGDSPYIVSEYVPGPSLEESVREAGPRTGAALERLALNTAMALAAIHRAGVLHRDFKPANILLGPDGPVVIDFGIARALDGGLAGMTHQGQFFGTPRYMAPEQFAEAPVGPPADVFAWAMTMVFAANGRPAFITETLPGLLHSIMNEEPDLGVLAGGLRDLVSLCLAKDPARRPSAEQLVAQLSGAHTPVPPAPQPLPRQAPPAPQPPPFLQQPPPTAPQHPIPVPQHTSPGVQHPAPGPQHALPAVRQTVPGVQQQPPIPLQVATIPPQEPPPGAPGRESGPKGNRRLIAVLAGATVVVLGAVTAAVLLSRGGTTPEAAAKAQADPQSSTLPVVVPSDRDAWSTLLPTPKPKAKKTRSPTPSPTTTVSKPPVRNTRLTERNLLANGGFNGADLAPWYLRGTVKQVTSGQRSGWGALWLTATPGMDAAAEQVTRLRPNTKYTLSGWVRSDGKRTVLGVKTADPHRGGWRAHRGKKYGYYSMTFTTGKDMTKASIFCWRKDSGQGYCDDVSLRAWQ